MIRIAAIGDVHVGRDARGFSGVDPQHLEATADLLLLAGDLTQHGFCHEAALLAEELAQFSLPIVCVLGNHDYHQGEEAKIRGVLQQVGVRVLEGETTLLQVAGIRLGVGGAKGFGGGFAGACATEFGEPEMKAFVGHSRKAASQLQQALSGLDCDIKIALTHYAPTDGTLLGEKREIYPFLGSYMLGEAIDSTRCHVAFHGHAHAGSERGLTRGGITVFNVARPVVNSAYKICVFERSQTFAAHDEENSTCA